MLYKHLAGRTKIGSNGFIWKELSDCGSFRVYRLLYVRICGFSLVSWTLVSTHDSPCIRNNIQSEQPVLNLAILLLNKAKLCPNTKFRFWIGSRSVSVSSSTIVSPLGPVRWGTFTLTMGSGGEGGGEMQWALFNTAHQKPRGGRHTIDTQIYFP